MERMMEIKMIQWTIQSNSRTFLSLILIPEICWNFVLNDIGLGVFCVLMSTLLYM